MRSCTLLALRQVSYCNSCFAKTRSGFLLLFFLLLLFGNNIYAQPAVVKGRVTRQNGEPLSGVSIIVKETKNGTTTQPDGTFEIEASPNNTLQISYVGFIAREIKVGSGNATIGVQLIENKNELEQIIVVGWNTKKIRCHRSHYFYQRTSYKGCSVL